MSRPLAAADSPVQGKGRIDRETLALTGALLVVLLLLQRFAIPFGAKPINLAGPLGFLIALIGVARGVLAIDMRRLTAFLAFVLCVAAGMAWQSMNQSPFGTAANLDSLAQFLALTSFAVFSFATPIDEARFFRVVTFWFACVAVAGLLQFAAQFAGLRVFQFTGILPEQMLYEANYNLVIPVGVAGLLKSNGFFLVEPSVFSQIMALGLMIELLSARRIGLMALFAAGLILSFSGTGLIVLLSFAGAAALAMGRRGVALAAGVALVLGLAAGLTFLLAPDLAASFGERAGEFSRVGTSAHMRFVTPFWLLEDVLSRAPSALLAGIGSGASEALYRPYLYNVNTPIKVFLEYGLPALVAYLSLFLLNERTRAQRALVVPGMVLFLFAGGYQQFPPILFLILLLLCVARLRPAAP